MRELKWTTGGWPGNANHFATWRRFSFEIAEEEGGWELSCLLNALDGYKTGGRSVCLGTWKSRAQSFEAAVDELVEHVIEVMHELLGDAQGLEEHLLGLG